MEVLYLCLCLCVFASCKTPRLPDAGTPAFKASSGVLENSLIRKAGISAQARAIVDSMDDSDLAAQVLMVGVDGSSELSDKARRFLADLHPGAVLFFGYNLNSSMQVLSDFTDSIYEAAQVSGLGPFIAIDHEGGTVFRFQSGVTKLPSARSIGAGADAKRRAARAGSIAGGELRALGISLNLAPVVEASAGPAAEFLQWRAWSADPARSGELAGVYLGACQKQGTACAAKHFPGTAGADPHSSLATLDVDRAAFESLYLRPFRQALKANPAVVMMSHVVVPCIDPKNPAPLSQLLVSRLLKGELGFDGIVLSDDIVMKALSGAGSMEQRVVAILAAGTDMVMVSGGVSVRSLHSAILDAVADGSLDPARLKDAAFRIVRQKIAYGLADENPETRKRRFRGFFNLVEANSKTLADWAGSP